MIVHLLAADWTQKEIATEIGISHVALRVDLFHARKRSGMKTTAGLVGNLLRRVQ